MKNKRKLLKTIIIIIAVLILLTILLVLIKTYTYPFEKHRSNSSSETLTYEVSEKSLKRLSGGIQIPTVSNQDHAETVLEPFERFMIYLREVYPDVYDKMESFTVNDYGIVLHWKGRNSQLNPILFLSHYDVVPVVGYDPADSVMSRGETVFNPASSGTPIQEFQEEWTYPPFSGAVADGKIYGRGTLDMKGMLFSILEAADALISEDFTPEQDIWIAYGQDEEVGGLYGATKIADFFKEQNLVFDAVYDEGGIIGAPGTGGVDKPLGLVGVAEKGFLSISIKVRGIGGHSSMPPMKSSLVYAAEIIEKLNDNQMPLRLVSPISSFLDNAGSEMGFASRMAIANKWLLKGVLLKTLSKTPATNALARTTTAITMAKGSDAANVLSSVSEVVVNFRLLVGDSVATVLRHVEDICKDYDTEIEVINAREPSKVSTEDTRGFRIIKETVGKLYPEAIVTSYLTIGGTDSRKYEIVSDNIYRFMPVFLNEYEQRTIHNENEHITFENYGKMIAYFKEIMKTFHER